jgi:hypothetical protein
MNYQNMPETSRVWVYQSNRSLNDAEVNEINKLAQHFTTSWDAHGALLSASITVFHQLFIVIMVDENVAQISGCAIDKSVGFIKKVEQHLNIHLFDRMAVAYQSENEINVCSFQQFQELINQGKVSEETLVFNNLVTTKKEFESNWLIPLKKSWHKRMVSLSTL